MAPKRKAAQEVPLSLNSPVKRRHQSYLNNDDPIYEETHSDAEYSDPGTPSMASDDMNDTPATPFSTTSSRYPSDLKTHRCPLEGCSKAFNRPARLQEHIRSHNDERIFRCTHANCDKTFLRSSHLAHHVKSAHTQVRDYICDRPGCDKSFVTGSRLRRHLATHDGKDKYRCTEYPPCNETFRKHSTLQKHITIVHLHEKPFPCPHINPTTGEKCQMAFDTAGNLRGHERRIHTEKRFSCAECTENAQDPETKPTGSSPNQSFTFPSYALLQEHVRAVHPPKCPNCPITCSTTRELRRHIEVAHGDATLDERKVFFCTEPGCDRSFTKKGNLTVHIRTVHEGEKRFACGETDLQASKKLSGWDGNGCGKRYGTKLALEEHVRTAHLGFQNAKAERRQRLGLTAKAPKVTENQMSTLAALTGQGYVEETGRRIPCFFEGCEFRFYRDYDLWGHTTAKHGCSEDEVQNLFMQRALLADQDGSGGNALGIYGLEFDNDDSLLIAQSAESPIQELSDPIFPDQAGLDMDFVMHDTFSENVELVDSGVPSHDEMGLIDPAMPYHLMEE